MVATVHGRGYISVTGKSGLGGLGTKPQVFGRWLWWAVAGAAVDCETSFHAYRTGEKGHPLTLSERPMLRTLFTIGLVALLGLVALKVVFGLLGPLVALLLMLLVFGFKIALVCLLLYVLLRIFSPGTASKIDSRFRN